jgi:hypothetical protein
MQKGQAIYELMRGLAREMGIRDDSLLMAHEDCYEILLDGKPSGIVELPADWVCDDGAYLWTERSRLGSLQRVARSNCATSNM